MKYSAATASRLAGLEHIDQKWAWHHCALLKLRQKLLHGRPAGDHSETVALQACGPDHESHSAHEVVLAELCRPEDRLPEIDAALARIRDHSYGICERTGATIAPSRLRALPWTRYAMAATERRRHPAKLSASETFVQNQTSGQR
jgi:RNA polymerase-binding transcription factor DksA